MDIIINVLIIAFIIWFVARNFIPVKGISQINTAELKVLLKDKKNQFIDVRTPMEYKGNHIKDFKNIPLNELRQRHQELSREKEVVVICQSGMRSTKASKLLKKKGFDKITNVRGGMATWRN